MLARIWNRLRLATSLDQEEILERIEAQQAILERIEARQASLDGIAIQPGGTPLESLAQKASETITANIGDMVYNFVKLEKLLDAAARKTPDEIFGAVMDDYWLWLNTKGLNTSSELRSILPGLPKDKQLEFAVVTLKGEENLTQGFGVYQLIKKTYEKYAGTLSSCAAILDFGCGWGRIIRFFLRDVNPARLFGADPWKECIESAKETNRWCQFQATNAMPPLPYAGRMFDFVYAWSVFSHFTESTHAKWLEELHRVTKPGGLLIATTMPRSYIEWVARLQKEFAEGTHKYDDDPDRKSVNEAAAKTFPNSRQVLAHYDRGGYCYSPYAGYTVGGTPWGDACIPKAYVLTHWSKLWTIVDYFDDEGATQSWIVAKKKI
jgi:ubiquinone/menaquinone biosynthesis C-methylase UbiE